MRARLINRRRQGDLGEASAIEWLTRVGGTVSIPFGHSPDYDLVVELGNELLKVQVKTSVFETRTPHGHPRFDVGLVTNGGNQSWSGVARRFEPSRADLLFVLIGDGRRWLIPTDAVEASNAICLGGPKYSEFEIEPGQPITRLVYGDDAAALESEHLQGEYPSGQRTATVNRLAKPSQVRILPPPSGRLERPTFERRDGRLGQTVVWGKRRVTIPLRPFDDAGLDLGDRLRVVADGPGRLIFERIEPGRIGGGRPG